MDYYKSCDTLPIYNFYKILEKEDFRYMLTNFNDLESADLKINEKTELDLKIKFDDISNEYAELTGNRSFLLSLKGKVDLGSLILEHDIIVSILNIFNEKKDIGCLLLLNELGYKIDLTKNIVKQVEKVNLDLKQLRNKIKIKEINFKNKNKSENEKIKVNLDKEALILEVNLKMGREINVRKMSVKKWHYLVEMNKQKLEAYG